MRSFRGRAERASRLRSEHLMVRISASEPVALRQLEFYTFLDWGHTCKCVYVCCVVDTASCLRSPLGNVVAQSAWNRLCLFLDRLLFGVTRRAALRSSFSLFPPLRCFLCFSLPEPPWCPPMLLSFAPLAAHTFQMSSKSVPWDFMCWFFVW